MHLVRLKPIFYLLSTKIDKYSNYTKYIIAGKNVTNILDSLLKDYDKRVRPEYSGPAVDVGITSKNAIKIIKLKMISI